jgi:aspartyl-tRNA(Asn)/glutamyl-tRNA(Gln) amidotransferase subunit C
MLYVHLKCVFCVFIGYNVYMTQISRDDVQHLAQLSSLRLSDDETGGLQEDISNILQYIEQLAELDTAGVEPTYQVTDLENVWRDDQVLDDHITREQLLALSPESANNQVKVPKVL